MRMLSSSSAEDQAQAWGRYHAPPPAPPHQSVTSFHQQGWHPLIGSAKAGRHVFTSFSFSKLNFKIQSLLRSISMRCDFPPPSAGARFGCISYGKGGRGVMTLCISPSHTHINNAWYMVSQRILLNLYCSWGQALNSPLKEHNGSSDRTHGISVCRAVLPLFHPVQGVTSCRHFFLQERCWPQLFAAMWLTHESVRWDPPNRLLRLTLYQSETAQYG